MAILSAASLLHLNRKKVLFHLAGYRCSRHQPKSSGDIFYCRRRRAAAGTGRRTAAAGNFSELPPARIFADVENAIDCFDIGVSTALWEGLPQSLVQLRLKKKAVVASDIPGNREVIRDGVNGYLVPINDHECFAAAILKLAADKVLRQQLGNYDGEDFSEWDAAVMVSRQEELYQRLLLPFGTDSN